ncbi:MAG: DMT family transporter [Chloroflexota bacterium]|nr:MAG: DMT family transporter [Chloroflexota bacterium]
MHGQTKRARQPSNGRYSRAMRTSDAGILILLAAIWGGSYPLIRIAVLEIGPAPLVVARISIAATILLAATFVARIRPPFERWRALILVGSLNLAAPFVLVTVAELRVSATVAAIIVTTAPLFAAFGSAWLLAERVRGRQVIGALLGTFGVAVLVRFNPEPIDGVYLLSVGALLGAALCYGFGAVLTRRLFGATPPVALASGQQTVAALILLPTLLLDPPGPTMPSLAAIASVLGLAVFATSIAYLLYFPLIGRIGPTRALTVTLLVPFFGALWGWLLLGEPLTVATFAGLGLILGSIGLVSAVPRSAPAVRQPAV